MEKERKINLYNELLGYLVNLIGDDEELVHVLRNLGFTDDEICYELGIDLNEVKGIYDD